MKKESAFNAPLLFIYVILYQYQDLIPFAAYSKALERKF